MTNTDKYVTNTQELYRTKVQEASATHVEDDRDLNLASDAITVLQSVP